MTLSAQTRRQTELRAAENLAALKDRYRALLQRLLAAFAPPLRNSELSLGLGLSAPTEGLAGASAVGRFVSTSPRMRGAVPDRFTRALLERIEAGAALVA